MLSKYLFGIFSLLSLFCCGHLAAGKAGALLATGAENSGNTNCSAPLVSVQQQPPLDTTTARVYFIENLGSTINTSYPEYSAVFTEDHRTIMFTTKRASQQQIEEGAAAEDILVATMDEKDEWQKPEKMRKLSTYGNDATVQLFDNDSKMIIYQRGDLLITELDLDNKKWGKPESLGKSINHRGSRESHGFIFNNGNSLIFSSSYKTKRKDLDLFISTKSNGEWTNARPLNEINTPYDEDSPFVAEDGTLYFSSQGHNSTGGFDIFASHFNQTTQRFEKPVNMGAPLNSQADDIFFNLKNSIAYFTSSRKGGKGSADIYRAYLFNNTNLSGSVLTLQGRVVGYGYELVFRSEEGDFTATTNADGYYAVDLPFYSEFQVSIQKNDEEVAFIESFTPDIALQSPRTTRKDFTIQSGAALPVFSEDGALPARASAEGYPADDEASAATAMEGEEVTREAFPVAGIGFSSKPPAVAKYSGTVRDSNSGKPLKAAIKLVETTSGRVAGTATSDIAGGFTITAEPGGNYQLVTEKAGYLSNRLQAKKGGNRLTVNLSPVGNAAGVVLQRLYFDHEKYNIRQKSYGKLSEAVSYLKQNPEVRIEVGGHTDSVGPEDLNIWLSDKRVEEVKNYFIDNGIAASRIVTKSYGESQPLVSNDDEKDGREINRRIELKILKP